MIGSPGRVRSLPGKVERLQSRPGADDGLPGQADLDAEHHVAMLLDRRQRLGHAGPLDVVQLTDLARDHPHRRDVHVREDASFAGLDHVLAEAVEGVGSGRSGIDDRRRTVGEAGLIRVDPVMGDAFEDVHMRVDQTRHDQHAVGIDHLTSLIGRDFGSDCRDPSTGEGDVAPVVDTLRGIDEGTARDDEIIGGHDMSPLRHSIRWRR